MNKDQIKGVAKDIAGKVQENTGKLIGSKEQEIKGQLKQVEGKIEKTSGDAQEAIKDIIKK
ncbi:CsbD family protein [Undibacterium sp. Ji49W]|uniref:CsbD family protein n=1 Tax=Undibacterium sp. Ji49W TaxID=3413040 RepID=UPI003BF06EAB